MEKYSTLVREALYDTLIRFKIAKPYMCFWNPDANGGMGEEYRVYAR